MGERLREATKQMLECLEAEQGAQCGQIRVCEKESPVRRPGGQRGQAWGGGHTRPQRSEALGLGLGPWALTPGEASGCQDGAEERSAGIWGVYFTRSTSAAVLRTD